jgi:uncharacterized protein YlzI (FlbEa/FlbD family)
MYIDISGRSKRFLNTNTIVLIDLGKAPPDSDIVLTLSSGEALIVKDETAKNKIIELLNLP